jgi:hypothetical protein
MKSHLNKIMTYGLVIGTLCICSAIARSNQIAPSPFTVGGRVFNKSRNGGVARVQMQFEVTSTDKACNLPSPVLTDKDGSWKQSGFTNGCSYKVKPYKPFYTFRLAFQPFSRPSNTIFFYQSAP